MKLPIRYLLVLSLVIFPAYSMAAEAQAKAQIIMGVFPHLPPRDLDKVYSPLAADLSEVVGQRVILRSSTTFAKYRKQLDDQVFDIAFVQPFDYIRVAGKDRYQPLATRVEPLAAIVVTKEESALSSLADLKGKTVALPPKTAAVAYLLKDHLRSNGLEPGKDVKLTHHRSHVSCMQQVLIGEAAACGTAAPAVRFFESKMKVKMKKITKSREIPHALFVIHSRVPKEKREKLREQILSWGNTPEGKKMLAKGKLSAFKVISDKDYDVVRKMAK